MARSSRRLLAAVAVTMLAAGLLPQVVSASTPAPGTASEVAALVAAAPSIGVLPSNVTPSVADAVNDTPFAQTPSLNRCFPKSATFTTLPACVYGDPHGKRTMVLWGDSHVFMWFPAVNAIALKNHWKLVALFKYGCPVADIPVWNVVVDAPYPSCGEFRTKVIARLKKLAPSLVLMSEEFATLGANKEAISTSQWTGALEKTFSMLGSKPKKVLIGSTIAGPYAYPSACLASSPTNIQRCSYSATSATPAAELGSEQLAAAAAKVRYVSVLPWTCSSVCTDVIGSMIAYYSAGHLSATYSSYLSLVLSAAVKTSM